MSKYEDNTLTNNKVIAKISRNQKFDLESQCMLFKGQVKAKV